MAMLSCINIICVAKVLAAHVTDDVILVHHSPFYTVDAGIDGAADVISSYLSVGYSLHQECF